MSTRPDLIRARDQLKDSLRLRIDFRGTAQARGLPAPPLQKPCPEGQVRIPLPQPGEGDPVTVAQAIGSRRSQRRYLDQPLGLRDLSFLLWATQGVQRRVSAATTLRTVPSAGARHALETYLAVLRVEGLEQGIYRYLPLEHALVLERQPRDLAVALSAGSLGQSWIAGSAVTFCWSTIPERMEWRYDLAAHRVIAMDAGHVCQNLYLACEAVGAGTCAIAAYDQQAMDALLGLDGQDEFTVYLAPVGRITGR
jgi:SagB-type dehydrogenase family enzyme